MLKQTFKVTDVDMFHITWSVLLKLAGDHVCVHTSGIFPVRAHYTRYLHFADMLHIEALEASIFIRR
jgi:hypothetical protein